MKELFFAILFFTMLSISCKDKPKQTIFGIEQARNEIDSIKNPLIFMDGKLLLEEEKEIITLKSINPFKDKSAVDSTIMLVKRLGKRGRIGRMVGLGPLGVRTSQDGNTSLVFNHINFNLSLLNKSGELLGEKSMKQYDLDGETASKYILREDGKGVLLYNHYQKVIDVYTLKEKELLLERQIKLPESNSKWKIRSTATNKIYLYSSNRKENTTAKIIVYDLSLGKEIKRKELKNTNLGVLTISPKEHFIISVHRRSSTVKIFNSQFELMKQIDGVQNGYDPSFYEKDGAIKMAYFTSNSAYIYDLSKEEISKLEIIKKDTFISDLVFLNDSTLLYGMTVTNTKNVFNDNTRITESYFYAQGIGKEKYLSLEKIGLGSIKFSKEEDKHFLLSKFRKKAGEVYEVALEN